MGHAPVVLGVGRQGLVAAGDGEVERLGQHGQGFGGVALMPQRDSQGEQGARHQLGVVETPRHLGRFLGVGLGIGLPAGVGGLLGAA